LTDFAKKFEKNTGQPHQNYCNLLGYAAENTDRKIKFFPLCAAFWHTTTLSLPKISVIQK